MVWRLWSIFHYYWLLRRLYRWTLKKKYCPIQRTKYALYLFYCPLKVSTGAWNSPIGGEIGNFIWMHTVVYLGSFCCCNLESSFGKWFILIELNCASYIILLLLCHDFFFYFLFLNINIVIISNGPMVVRIWQPILHFVSKLNRAFLQFWLDADFDSFGDTDCSTRHSIILFFDFFDNVDCVTYCSLYFSLCHTEWFWKKKYLFYTKLRGEPRN